MTAGACTAECTACFASMRDEVDFRKLLLLRGKIIDLLEPAVESIATILESTNEAYRLRAANMLFSQARHVTKICDIAVDPKKISAIEKEAEAAAAAEAEQSDEPERMQITFDYYRSPIPEQNRDKWRAFVESPVMPPEHRYFQREKGSDKWVRVNEDGTPFDYNKPVEPAIDPRTLIPEDVWWEEGGVRYYGLAKPGSASNEASDPHDHDPHDHDPHDHDPRDYDPRDYADDDEWDRGPADDSEWDPDDSEWDPDDDEWDPDDGEWDAEQFLAWLNEPPTEESPPENNESPPEESPPDENESPPEKNESPPEKNESPPEESPPDENESPPDEPPPDESVAETQKLPRLERWQLDRRSRFEEDQRIWQQAKKQFKFNLEPP